MKGDTNPSFVVALFGKPEINDAVIKDLNNKNGMKIREFRLLDISMPMDKRYNENLNYIKHFSMPMMKRFILDINFPFKDKIFSMLHKQSGLKMLNYNEKSWKYNTRHKFLYSGFTPLAFDTRYINKCETKEERRNFKQAETFSSDNFKPIINGKETNPSLLIKDDLLK